MKNSKLLSKRPFQTDHRHSASQTYSRRERRHLVVKNRYEILHLLSSALSSLLFLAGSLFMFYSDLRKPASVLFILGSIQMLLRSLISLSYHFYLKRHIRLHSSSSNR
ncbi:YrhK family protein [Paenibacillus terreus]|uniref:YrhK family protein n=1 Tax=Paenibacillus terreus TaxID=1387834 RepID=A0ABV5B8K1_9BACL